MAGSVTRCLHGFVQRQAIEPAEHHLVMLKSMCSGCARSEPIETGIATTRLEASVLVQSMTTAFGIQCIEMWWHRSQDHISQRLYPPEGMIRVKSVFEIDAADGSNQFRNPDVIIFSVEPAQMLENALNQKPARHWCSRLWRSLTVQCNTAHAVEIYDTCTKVV